MNVKITKAKLEAIKSALASDGDLSLNKIAIAIEVSSATMSRISRELTSKMDPYAYARLEKMFLIPFLPSSEVIGDPDDNIEALKRRIEKLESQRDESKKLIKQKNKRIKQLETQLDGVANIEEQLKTMTDQIASIAQATGSSNLLSFAVPSIPFESQLTLRGNDSSIVLSDYRLTDNAFDNGIDFVDKYSSLLGPNIYQPLMLEINDGKISVSSSTPPDVQANAWVEQMRQPSSKILPE